MTRRVARCASLYAAVVLALACTRDLDGPARTAPPTPSRRVAGVVEITFRNIGSPNMTASAIVGSTVAEVEAIRAAQMRQAPAGTARFDLTVPEISPGVPGNRTIELRLHADGATASTTTDTRYFSATFDVRNAQLDSTALGTERHNLTFLPVGANGRTIGDTPLLVFSHDATPITALDILHQLKPSGLIAINGGNAVVPVSPDVMQVFTEGEIAAFEAAAQLTSVNNIFPYGFVVHHVGSSTDRTLLANPGINDFAGEVSFAFRMPLQTPSTNDPTTITVLMLALDDSDVRVTQSLEEQAAPGPDSVAERAASLGATQVRLLAGGSVPTAIPTQSFCSVRTAGFAGAATASLTNPNVGAFDSLTPNPHSGSKILTATTTLSATFSSPVSNAGSSNFVVSGLQSGPKFRGQAYTSSGNAVTTPTPATPNVFKPGEDVDVTLTAGVSCPPWVGRLNVRVTAGSSSNLSGGSNNGIGNGPTAIAVGDYDGDGFSDLAVRMAGATGNTAVDIIRNNNGSLVNNAGAITLPAGQNTNTGAIVAADFNRDGKLDIAFLNGNDVLVYLNGSTGAGNFTFTAGTGAPGVGTSPQDLAVGDFNADGIPDLVVTFPDHVAVLLGTGTGAFQPPQTIPTGAGTRAVVVGDLNNDGIFDLVVGKNAGDGTGSLTEYLGNGDGTFREGQIVAPTPLVAGLAIGDLNNDGHLDVATADSTANTVSVRYGNPDGTLGTLVTLPSGATGAAGATRLVVMADMNGDGFLDLLFSANPGSGANVRIYLKSTTGTGFGSVLAGSNSNFTTQIVPLILNNNGALDVVIPQGVGQTQIRVYTR